MEGIAAARREGLDRRYGLNLRAAAADVLLRLGRWDEADALVAEGRSLDPDGEGPLYLVIVRLRLATARGRFDEARRALDVGNRAAAGDVDFDLVAYLRTAEAELACWTGPARPGGDGRRGRPGGARGQRRRLPRRRRSWPSGPGPPPIGPRRPAPGGTRPPSPTTGAAVARPSARLDAPRRGRARRHRPVDPRAGGDRRRWARAEAGARPASAGRGRLGAASRRRGTTSACRPRRRTPAGGARRRSWRGGAAVALRPRTSARPRRRPRRLGAEPLGAAVAVAGPAVRDPPPGGRRGAAERARTFMFTDIVGSTALIETIGDDAWTALRAWHDATLPTALRGPRRRRGGPRRRRVLRDVPVARSPAVACAVEIQRTLAEHRRAAGFAPGVRIGLHHGEAVRSGAGWAGREVHVAARLMARAGAGEIVASAATLAAAGPAVDAAEPVSLPGLAGTVAAAAVPWR